MTTRTPAFTKTSLARTVLFVTMLLTTLGLFGAGIYLPFVTISKFLFFDHTVSILTSLRDLLANAEYAIFTLIFVFTILTPIIKLTLMALVWFRASDRQTRYLHNIAKYGKWSMLDVFVVAVMVVLIKLDGIAEVEVHLGAYLFATSVLLSMALTAWLTRLLQE